MTLPYSNSKGRLRPGVAKSIVVWLTLLLLIAAASVPRTLRAHTNVESDQSAQNDLPILEPGKPISRELSGGEVHSYQIVLTAKQFVRVAVDQRGINLIVTLHDSNGKRIAQVDSWVGLYGTENASLVSETAGS